MRLAYSSGLLIKKHEKFCSVCYLPHAGFLLGLFFDPEDGGEKFI
jgi:hypothetical protein